MADDKPQYQKPASQLDLEARQKNGNASDRVLSTAPQKGEVARPDDAPGYVGTDPMYQNAANHTEAPGMASSGAESKIFGLLSGEKQERVVPTADVSPEDENPEEGDPNADTSGSSQSSSTSSSSQSSSGQSIKDQADAAKANQKN